MLTKAEKTELSKIRNKIRGTPIKITQRGSKITLSGGNFPTTTIQLGAGRALNVVEARIRIMKKRKARRKR